MAKIPNKNGHSPAKPSERLPTAYFLSLELENVRCFGPKQKLDLSDGKGKPAPWTIILGVNGTGKTTLLQSLVKMTLVKPDSGIKKYLPRFIMEGVNPHLDFNRNATEVTPPVWNIKYHISTSINNQDNYTFGGKTTLYPGLRNFDIGGPNSDLSISTFAYGAGRRVGELSFLEESEEDDPTGTLFTDKAKLRSPEAWLLTLDYSASKPSDVQKQQALRYKLVVELLIGILWEIDDIRCDPTEGTHPKPRVEFKTPYGWVPFRQLGYGYQSLATWVADFASRMVERYPESKNPLEEPAVVLVDEIDLHLHPKWQRELMDRLTKLFPNTQFIATAHSPLIAQAAADANLAVLRREGDHVVIDNDVDYIRNWRVDQILTSDLFGLDSARPPHIAKLLSERDAILGKSKLTKADEKELKRLETEIGELPVGETKQQRQEMDQIRKNLDRLLLKEGLTLE